MRKDKRKQYLMIRVSNDEKEVIIKAAEANHDTVSNFVRRVLLDIAQKEESVSD